MMKFIVWLVPVSAVYFIVTAVDFTVTAVDFTVTAVDFAVSAVDFAIAALVANALSGSLVKLKVRFKLMLGYKSGVTFAADERSWCGVR